MQAEEVIIKTNMTIRLLSLLATLNKAVKAEPPVVTLALLATLKEVEEEIKQTRSGFGLVLSLKLSLILHECSLSTYSQQGWRRAGARVLYQITR